MMALFNSTLELTFEIVTLAIALYAAILSTFVTLFKIRTRVKVIFREGLTTPDSYYKKVWDIFIIEAVNVGSNPTTLEAPSLLFPKRYGVPNRMPLYPPFAQTNVTFPHVLEPGRTCEVRIDQKKVAQVLTHKDQRRALFPKGSPDVDEALYTGKIKIRAGFKTTAGEKFKSKEKLSFDINSALKGD